MICLLFICLLYCFFVPFYEMNKLFCEGKGSGWGWDKLLLLYMRASIVAILLSTWAEFCKGILPHNFMQQSFEAF